MSATSRRKKRPKRPKKNSIYIYDDRYFYFHKELGQWLNFDPMERRWNVGIVPFEYKAVCKKESPFERTNKLKFFLTTDEFWHTEANLLNRVFEEIPKHRDIIESTLEVLESHDTMGWISEVGIVVRFYDEYDTPPPPRVKVYPDWSRRSEEGTYVIISGEIIRLMEYGKSKTKRLGKV